MTANISEHITYLEAVKTNTGLINKPHFTQLQAMKAVASHVFEPLRVYYGKPILVNSFYRSETVNHAVGGARNSQHVKGEAIDITAQNKDDNRKLFFWIKLNAVFDQLIWEKGNTNYPDWIHVSYKADGKNRNQIIYNL